MPGSLELIATGGVDELGWFEVLLRSLPGLIVAVPSILIAMHTQSGASRVRQRDARVEQLRLRRDRTADAYARLIAALIQINLTRSADEKQIDHLCLAMAQASLESSESVRAVAASGSEALRARSKSEGPGSTDLGPFVDTCTKVMRAHLEELDAEIDQENGRINGGPQ